MRYYSKPLLIGVAVLALSSCVEDESVSPATVSDSICFGSNAVAWDDPDIDAPHSRAEQLPLDMGCYAFYNRNDEHSLIISDSRYVRNSSGIYISDDVVYWPGSHATLDFYHYAPYGADGLEFDRAYGVSSFSYTIPKAWTDRCDLLLASTPGVAGDFNNVKDIQLKHALTGVKFEIVPEMGNAIINFIKFTGIHCSGIATFDADGNVQWTVSGTADNEFDFDAENINYLIPQALDEAMMTINLTRDGSGQTITLPLTAEAFMVWTPGSIVTYRLKITQDIEIEVVNAIDAHYVLCPATIRMNRVAPSLNWTMTASASDGADVTIQRLSDVNQFVREGFWTDKYLNDGRSARGTASITGKGKGDVDLMIFAPENIGNTDRIITLTITASGETEPIVTNTIIQYCPDWDHGGWERIDDGYQGMYGFLYTTKNVYVYNERSTETHIGMSMNRAVELVETNNAEEYTTVEMYTFKTSDKVWEWCFYVEIDYSRLNILGERAKSEIDGLGNTRELFTYGGSGITHTFETTLQGMHRWDGSSKLAFRRRTKGERLATDPSNESDPFPEVPREVEGSSLTGIQALALVLKKNKYNIKVDNSEIGTSESPELNINDILWYMPAVSEFQDFSPWIVGTAAPGQIWSSTSVNDVIRAKGGDGVQHNRTENLHVRARRINR